jgi:hypothetical protein
VHEPYTEHHSVPGWGVPFPPEQPRRDAPPATMPDGTPTAAEVAWASTMGEEAPIDPRQEDRRALDRRRRRARFVDSLLMVPLAAALYFLFEGVTVGAVLLVVAVDLSYHFVMEMLRGQSIGKKAMKLRVVCEDDGTAAGATKIATRTIFRLLDNTFLGPLTVLLSGKRRKRLGDLAAGTCVRNDDRRFVPAPETPMVVVYPLLWIGAALAAMVVFKPVDPMYAMRSNHPYMAKIDQICEKRARQAEALAKSQELNLITSRVLHRQETRKIEKLPPPPADVKADVREVIRHHRKINRALDRVVRDMHRSNLPAEQVVDRHRPIVDGLAEQADARYVALGLPYCAASE